MQKDVGSKMSGVFLFVFVYLFFRSWFVKRILKNAEDLVHIIPHVTIPYVSSAWRLYVTLGALVLRLLWVSPQLSLSCSEQFSSPPHLHLQSKSPAITHVQACLPLPQVTYQCLFSNYSNVSSMKEETLVCSLLYPQCLHCPRPIVSAW